MRVRNRVCIGLLVGAVFLVYGNALLNGFTYDDGYYILRNPQVTNPTALGLLTPHPFSKVFRPVTFSTFALNWVLGSGRPFGFHLINVLLHAAVTLLFYLLLQAILVESGGSESKSTVAFGHSNTVAFAAALLFAAHPLHTEAVSSIVGRSELLAAGFLFAGWICHLRDRNISMMICFTLALLSKESAVVFLPMLLVMDYARGKWKPHLRYVLVGVVTLLYLGIVWKLHADHFGDGFVTSPLDNALATIPAKWRILNALRVAWKYLGLHVYPVSLSCDYSFNQIHIYFDWRHTLAAALGTLLVALGWMWAIYRRRIGLALAGTIYLIGFATTANVLVPTGTIMGERLAYLPSAGFCLLLALGWHWLRDKRQPAAWVALSFIIAAFGVRTIARNRDWKDNLSLFASAVRAVPESAQAHAHLGGSYMEKREFEMAATEFDNSLRIYPDNPDALSAYGLLEWWRGDYPKAARLMENALNTAHRDNPNYDFIAVNYAALLMQTGEMGGALDLLNREIVESPSYARAWSNRAVIYVKRGESGAARSDAETALRLDPGNVQAQGVLRELAGSDKPISTH